MNKIKVKAEVDRKRQSKKFFQKKDQNLEYCTTINKKNKKKILKCSKELRKIIIAW